MIEALAIELLTFHMVDGREVNINPEQITRLMNPLPDGEGNKELVDDVHCVIMFVDRGYVSVAESCDEVRKAIGNAK